VKLKPEELAPFATAIVERLVPILQNMNSMPRSIVENRCVLGPRLTMTARSLRNPSFACSMLVHCCAHLCRSGPHLDKMLVEGREKSLVLIGMESGA
jgi:hypothetical protein